MAASCALSDFSLPQGSKWTSYSAILREDFGWVTEPGNQLLTSTAMKDLLSDVASIKVRGDLWVYSSQGYGQETVYLQDVYLFEA